jgi:hypothetical protein
MVMPLARISRSVNWRHAIGELLLIIVGILIALAVADWNEKRLLREQEKSLLVELRTELGQDLEAIDSALAEALSAERQLLALAEGLRARKPYEPSMDTLFGAVYGTRIIFLNSAAHEALASVGLQIVSDNDLRLRIARLFSEQYKVMNMNNDIDMDMNLEVFRPYYLHNFRDLRFKQSATPINYDRLVDDPYYANIVDYRRIVLRANRITSYTVAVTEIGELLALLDEYLD